MIDTWDGVELVSLNELSDTPYITVFKHEGKWAAQYMPFKKKKEWYIYYGSTPNEAIQRLATAIMYPERLKTTSEV